MSIGNLKTYGNKGFNTPYQLGSLQVLQQILEAIAATTPVGGLATETTLLSVKDSLQHQKSAAALSSTGTGSLAVVSYSFSVYNAGANDGSFTTAAGTITLPKGVTLNFDAGGAENTFAANTFSWNATGTSYIITYTY